MKREIKEQGRCRICRVHAVCMVCGNTIAPWRQVALNSAIESTNVSLAIGRFDANVKARSARRWVIEHLLPVLRVI